MTGHHHEGEGRYCEGCHEATRSLVLYILSKVRVEWVAFLIVVIAFGALASK